MIAALTDIVARCPQWGFWKCFTHVRLQGHPWNHTRVHRVGIVNLNLSLAV